MLVSFRAVETREHAASMRERLTSRTEASVDVARSTGTGREAGSPPVPREAHRRPRARRLREPLPHHHRRPEPPPDAEHARAEGELPHRARRRLAPRAESAGDDGGLD